MSIATGSGKGRACGRRTGIAPLGRHRRASIGIANSLDPDLFGRSAESGSPMPGEGRKLEQPGRRRTASVVVVVGNVPQQCDFQSNIIHARNVQPQCCRLLVYKSYGI
jgi:hypothetical protein